MNAAPPLLPCEKLLFHNWRVTIGRFECHAEDRLFARTSPVHNHLFVLTRQPLWWRRAEGSFRFAEPGAALFHRPGGEIQRRGVDARGDVSDWFGFHPDVFFEAMERHGLDHAESTQRVSSIVTSLPFRLRENRLVTGLQQGQLSTLAAEELAFDLLDDVCRCFSGQPSVTSSRRHTRHRRQRLIDRTRRLLDSAVRAERGMAPEITLDELAADLGVSVFHLSRVFREETGLTLHGYRQRQRIGRALELMERSRQDLTALAHRLGYSSHSHFSRVFKSLTGSAPSLLNNG